MKKLILCILFIGLLITPCFAEKNITLDKIENMRGYIAFNGAYEGKRYPIVIRIDAQATGDGLRQELSNYLALGQPSDESYTPKEIYQFIKNNVGQSLADKLKDIYLEGIAEDISEE